MYEVVFLRLGHFTMHTLYLNRKALKAQKCIINKDKRDTV